MPEGYNVLVDENQDEASSIEREDERTTSSGIETQLLEGLLAEAITLRDETTTGSAIGSCSEISKARLSEAITEGKRVLEMASTQGEIDQAVTSLSEAVQAFKESIIGTSQGDVNADEIINIGDLALAAYYYQAKEGQMHWQEAKRADVNKDYQVDSIDLAIIAQNVLEK